jgi:hypothetical protein
VPETYLGSLYTLWDGCILGSIAHAVAISRWPHLANEQSWDGHTYSVHDSMGSRGTVCFVLNDQGDPVRCAGAVFNPKSDRGRLAEAPTSNPFRFFVNAGSDQRSLAQQAFQYLLEVINGRPIPCITGGFWSDGDCLLSQDPWPIFLLYGGHLFERQFFGVQKAVDTWSQNYALTPREIEVIMSLYEQKKRKPKGWLELTRDQHAVIEKNQVGIDQCWESFAELQIKFPISR